LDYYTVVAQQVQLARELVGRKIEIVRLREHRDLYLGFEGDTALKLACIPDMPYLHLMEKRFIPRREAQDWHSARFVGKSLLSIERTPGDRILSFTVGTGFRIVFELTGRNANLLAINPEGTIIGSLRIITARESAYRSVRPGVKYLPPPPRDIPSLTTAARSELAGRLEAKEGEVLASLSALCGGSRLFAAEVLALAEIDPLSTVSALSPDEKSRVLNAAAELALVIEKGGEGGTVVRDGREGLPRDVFPLPLGTASPPSVYHESLNQAITEYARDRETALERKSLRQFIDSVLTREERNIRATILKVERDRGQESEPERLERQGDVILASLPLVKRGMHSATLPDPYAGREIEIELDPVLDGPANADRFYSRARKLRIAAKLAVERIASLGNRLEGIRTERARLESLEDLRGLRDMAARYARRTAAPREREIEEKFPRRYISVSGLEIIVGRNDEENDELVRWARKDDIWLHAQGVGGSHVILRGRNKQMPDHRSVVQAASLAAYYSKAKTSAIVPVVWTPLKYVVKRKGQGPGQVTYTREKVEFVEPADIRKDESRQS
jgi:predicted ribosome quality control (RQC) complex YloA/Tae2 family protein